MRRIISLALPLLVLASCPAAVAAGAASDRTVGFFGSGAVPVLAPGPYDPAIPSPGSFLGFAVGERPARHARVVAYFEALAKATPRVEILSMGETYEGRPLVYAVISGEANMNRLPGIRAGLDRLADPRRVSRSEVQKMIDTLPAVVWLAYSIHGDEISGTDASLAVAYRLAAGTDSVTERLRRDLVIVIDPCENPDGRERFLAQMESFASAVPQADGQSLQKGGIWPWGRGNHYLFDMNRDWFAVELKETEARVAAITAWHPQLLVDAHEMGAWDTYLFNPPRPPFNPQLTAALRRWWDVFAADQAAAFDRFGWAYYSREWNEEFYPGYGSSWPLYQGTVGILYEQAGVSGSRVARHDGTVMMYSESVAHHYVSSMANTTTAADHRRELLEGYYDHRAEAVSTYGGGPARAFLVAPDSDVDRMDDLARALSAQGIEVYAAAEAVRVKARSYYDSTFASRTLPAGTMVIPANQPNGYLVQTILGFDPRLPDSELVLERRELLKHRESRLYEVTGWSLLQGYAVEAYETGDAVTARLDPWKPAAREGGIDVSTPDQGFVFSTESERGRRAVAMLFSRGVTMHAAKKALDVDGRAFARGSIFVPRRANTPAYAQVLDSVGKVLGVPITGIQSGKGAIGPDLGGGEVGVLRRPRTAIVADEPTSGNSAGAIWHLLDWKLGLPVSLVPASRLSWLDLSVYNVIILPDSWGSYARTLGPGAAENLAGWVEGGGTLIAIGGGADYCVDSTVHLSAVRLREDVLEKLADYQEAARREVAAEAPDLKGLQVWTYRGEKKDSAAAAEHGAPPLDLLKKEDELARLFAPHGVIMRTDLDKESWLAFGLGDRVPVMLYSSRTLMAQLPPVETMARFAEAGSLRLSGLLWPEARARVAQSAFCTRERKGRGQIILFADDPAFRAYFRGSARLLTNAVLFGPGLGTDWTPEW
jgi:hypothetical protein